MNMLLEAFDRLAETPNAVARLRELVLQLAVQGRLVPQDPADEPASALLERIRTAKQQSLGTLVVDSNQPLETPYELPAQWIWTTFDHVTTYIQRGKSPAYVDISSIPVISQKCIQWSGFDITKARFIDEDSIANYDPIRFLRSGDLLWNSTGLGTVGRANVYVANSYKTVVADSHVTVVRPVLIESQFMYLVIASPFVQSTINDKTTGSTKQTELSTGVIKSHPFPLPPLAEQRRIVAKVDALMALCDQLEAEQRTRDGLRDHLHAALIHDLAQTDMSPALVADGGLGGSRTLNLAKSARDVGVADGGRTRTNQPPLLFAHFDELHTTPRSVARLRETILQLAVQGQLVPQNPADEPASALLERIRAAKQRLIAAGTLKREKDLAPINPDDVPFDLPAGWEWTRLGDLVFSIQTGPFGSNLHKSDYVPNGFPVINPASIQNEKIVPIKGMMISESTRKALSSYI